MLAGQELVSRPSSNIGSNPGGAPIRLVGQELEEAVPACVFGVGMKAGSPKSSCNVEGYSMSGNPGTPDRHLSLREQWLLHTYCPHGLEAAWPPRRAEDPDGSLRFAARDGGCEHLVHTAAGLGTKY